jgi:hypothetical protein
VRKGRMLHRLAQVIGKNEERSEADLTMTAFLNEAQFIFVEPAYDQL